MISEKALVARINRRLAHRGLCLRKMRWPTTNELGEFVLVDTYTNAIQETHQDLSYLAKTEHVFSTRDLLLGKNEGWRC